MVVLAFALLPCRDDSAEIEIRVSGDGSRWRQSSKSSRWFLYLVRGLLVDAFGEIEASPPILGTNDLGETISGVPPRIARYCNNWLLDSPATHGFREM
mmetsp:Transcript_82313/g.129621  ORF Transcript_82313/g.129621 Transcript_82313/m.129621 type:complete len:98 (-) Transcript_82313:817-1110(-)